MTYIIVLNSTASTSQGPNVKTNNSKHPCALTAASTYYPLHRMNRHVYVSVHALWIPGYIFAGRSRAQIRRAPQFHWPPNSRRSASSPDAPAHLRATMSSRTAQPLPHAALRRRRRRPRRNACHQDAKNEHFLIQHLSPARYQGVSPVLHTTEPTGSPKCAASSS